MTGNNQLDTCFAHYRAVQGTTDEEAALKGLYHQLNIQAHKVINKVLQRKNDELAWDIATNIVMCIGDFEGRSAFSTWSWKVATNEALMYIRAKNRLDQYETPISEDADTADWPMPIRDIADLKQALQHLEDTEAEYIRLRLKGHTLPEIAAQLNMTPAGVKIFNHRVLNELRKVMENGEVGE